MWKPSALTATARMHAIPGMGRKEAGGRAWEERGRKGPADEREGEGRTEVGCVPWDIRYRERAVEGTVKATVHLHGFAPSVVTVCVPEGWAKNGQSRE